MTNHRAPADNDTEWTRDLDAAIVREDSWSDAIGDTLLPEPTDVHTGPSIRVVNGAGVPIDAGLPPGEYSATNVMAEYDNEGGLVLRWLTDEGDMIERTLAWPTPTPLRAPIRGTEIFAEWVDEVAEVAAPRASDPDTDSWALRAYNAGVMPRAEFIRNRFRETAERRMTHGGYLAPVSQAYYVTDERERRRVPSATDPDGHMPTNDYGGVDTFDEDYHDDYGWLSEAHHAAAAADEEMAEWEEILDNTKRALS